MDSSVKPAGVVRLSVCLCVCLCATNEEAPAAARPSVVFDVAATALCLCSGSIGWSSGAQTGTRKTKIPDRKHRLPEVLTWQGHPLIFGSLFFTTDAFDSSQLSVFLFLFITIAMCVFTLFFTTSI